MWCGRDSHRWHENTPVSAPGSCPQRYAPISRTSDSFTAFRDEWLVEHAAGRPTLEINGDRVPRVFTQRIVGRTQSADGDDLVDLEERLSAARRNLAAKRHVWAHPKLPRRFRRMLYKAIVVGQVLHSIEQVHLGAKAVKMLTTFNETWCDRLGLEPPYAILGEAHLRRLRYLGHVLRSEVTPEPGEPIRPEQTLRTLLMGIKLIRANGVRRRPFAQHLRHLDLIEADGGVSPHVGDYDIDVEATHRVGTIFELAPRFSTFAELWDYAHRGGTPTEQTLLWNIGARAAVGQWLRDHDLPPLDAARSLPPTPPS